MKLPLYLSVTVVWVSACVGCDSTGTASSCFLTGTEILTPQGPVPIEQLESGDTVISVDPANGRTMETLVSTIKSLSARDYVVLITSDDGHVKVTRHQPFWSQLDSQFREVGEFNVGDKIGRWVNGQLKWVSILAIEEAKHSSTVYHLAVDQDPHTFVANTYLVHNKPPVPPPATNIALTVTPGDAGWIRVGSRRFMGQPPDTVLFATIGERIKLEAVPRFGWAFDRWEGDVAWTDSFITVTYSDEGVWVRCLFDTLP